MRFYLDHAATTEVRAIAREAMQPYLSDAFANPSGVHRAAQRAKNAMEEARERAAELIGALRPLEIVFTGGGTEADNLAVAGAALAGGSRGGVVTTAIEHEAVLETAEFLRRLGCPVASVGVDAKGRVNPAAVAAATSETTAVVSVMAANNEIGTIEPVREIADAVRATATSAVVHTDAVQAFVSEPISVDSTGADLISLAAHKFGGPKGVGLLYVRDGIELEPVIHGGGQELGRRSGTHNVAGIVGMVAAMDEAVALRERFRIEVGGARDRFETQLTGAVPDLEINGDVDRRLVQHSHVRIPGVATETLLIRLDQAGIAAAAGSACQSGAIEVSHVLAACGFTSEAAGQCVRFSFGWGHTATDGELAAKAVADVVEALR
jgi:cysteine desulfurase